MKVFPTPLKAAKIVGWVGIINGIFGVIMFIMSPMFQLSSLFIFVDIVGIIGGYLLIRNKLWGVYFL